MYTYILYTHTHMYTHSLYCDILFCLPQNFNNWLKFHLTCSILYPTHLIT